MPSADRNLPEAKPRKPRSRGMGIRQPERTRRAILDAATAEFSSRGLGGARIDAIAKRAGTNKRMIYHYFGNKENLFAAAVKLPVAPEQALEHIFEGPPSEIGLRLARLFFGIWEIPETREALIGQLRMAFTTDRPPPMRDFLAHAILKRVEKEVNLPNAKLRVELAASHLLGVALIRYVLRLEPLASTPISRLISEVAPRITSYLAADQGN